MLESQRHLFESQPETRWKCNIMIMMMVIIVITTIIIFITTVIVVVPFLRNAADDVAFVLHSL